MNVNIYDVKSLPKSFIESVKIEKQQLDLIMEYVECHEKYVLEYLTDIKNDPMLAKYVETITKLRYDTQHKVKHGLVELFENLNDISDEDECFMNDEYRKMKKITSCHLFMVTDDSKCHIGHVWTWTDEYHHECLKVIGIRKSLECLLSGSVHGMAVALLKEIEKYARSEKFKQIDIIEPLEIMRKISSKLGYFHGVLMIEKIPIPVAENKL